MASAEAEIRHVFGDTCLTEGSIGAAPPDIVKLSDRSREYSKSMEYLEVNRLILKFWQSFYILYQICTT